MAAHAAARGHSPHAAHRLRGCARRHELRPDLDLRACARCRRGRSVPENFDGSARGRRPRDRGHRAPTAPATSGPAGRSRRASTSRRARRSTSPRSTGAGKITHIWITTHTDNWRTLILRAYWDGADEPAVEVPYGDFFCNGWGVFAQVNSQVIAANPHGGFNSYWPMPFRDGARLTIENTLGRRRARLLPGHLRDRRRLLRRRLPPRAVAASATRSRSCVPHTILEGIEGLGQYVGTYIAWGVNSNGWWGEGEIKFYLDDDDRLPDDLRHRHRGLLRRRVELRHPRAGLHGLLHPVPRHAAGDPAGRPVRVSQQRFGMYRWHLRGPDPLLRAACRRSTSRRSGGAAAGATCRCATTSPRPRCSTSTARPPDGRSPRPQTTWRST